MVQKSKVHEMFINTLEVCLSYFYVNREKFLVAFPFHSFSSELFLKEVSNLCFTGPNCSGHSLESTVRATVCRRKVSGGCALSERQHCGGISPLCLHTAAVREHKR